MQSEKIYIFDSDAITYKQFFGVFSDVPQYFIEKSSWLNGMGLFFAFTTLSYILYFAFILHICRRLMARSPQNRSAISAIFTSRVLGFVYFHWSCMYVLNYITLPSRIVTDLAKFVVICIISPWYSTIFKYIPLLNRNQFPTISLLTVLITCAITGTKFLKRPLLFESYFATYLIITILKVFYILIKTIIDETTRRPRNPRNPRRSDEDQSYTFVTRPRNNTY